MVVGQGSSRDSDMCIAIQWGNVAERFGGALCVAGSPHFKEELD